MSEDEGKSRVTSARRNEQRAEAPAEQTAHVTFTFVLM